MSAGDGYGIFDVFDSDQNDEPEHSSVGYSGSRSSVGCSSDGNTLQNLRTKEPDTRRWEASRSLSPFLGVLADFQAHSEASGICEQE